jgi:hypothetical protein
VNIFGLKVSSIWNFIHGMVKQSNKVNTPVSRAKLHFECDMPEIGFLMMVFGKLDIV